MKLYRILFTLWLLFWLGVWFFGGGNTGIYIVSATIICLTADILITEKISKNLTSSVTVPATAGKNETIPITAVIENSCIFSAANIRIKMQCKNLLTGETQIKTVQTAAGGKNKTTAFAEFSSPHCGKTTVSVIELSVTDVFGVVSFKAESGKNAAVLILPGISPVKLSIGDNTVKDTDSTEYSMKKPGDDPGETFALREYRAGDRLRDIHRKLSEKTDTLIVREYGLPVNNSVLILADTVISSGTRSAEEREAIGETVISLSAALCEMSFPHDIGIYDNDRKQISLVHIVSEDDLNAELSYILSAQTTEDERTITEIFAEERTPEDFSHIIVVTNNADNDRFIGQTAVSYTAIKTERTEGLYVEI